MGNGKYKGKIVVGAIGIFLLLLAMGVLEFQYGMIQRTVYTFKVNNYLKETYNEPMSIRRVTYLWDNIEPISARVHPKSSSELEFSVFPHKEKPSGFRDNYVETLWLHQATEEVEKSLLNVDGDFKSQLFLDFPCCTGIDDKLKVNRGVVPSYTQSNLKFDLTFQLNRGLQTNDLQQMYRIITALKQQEHPKIGIILFLLQPEGESYRIEYKIPGKNLKDIRTVGDLKDYNQSRFPARELASLIEAEISWDLSNSRVVFTKGDTVLEMNNWGEEVLLNGTPLANPLPFFIGEQGNLLIPVAVLEEAFQVDIPLVEAF
jgi:hypothetical protein